MSDKKGGGGNNGGGGGGGDDDEDMPDIMSLMSMPPIDFEMEGDDAGIQRFRDELKKEKEDRLKKLYGETESESECKSEELHPDERKKRRERKE